jgi:hypothetical protein
MYKVAFVDLNINIHLYTRYSTISTSDSCMPPCLLRYFNVRSVSPILTYLQTYIIYMQKVLGQFAVLGVLCKLLQTFRIIS